MTLLDNLPHTVSHYRKMYEQDEYLGNTTGTTALATDVKAWVQNANMRDVAEYQKEDETITHKVLYASNPSLRPGDTIVVTAGPSFVGVTMNYKTSTDRSAGLGWLFTAMCEQENNVPVAFST
jgi:hypothetical protein